MKITSNLIIILSYITLTIGINNLIVTWEKKEVINEEQKNYIIEQARSGEKIIKVGGEIEEVLLYENGILEFKKEKKEGSVWKVTKNEPGNIVVKMVDNKGEIVYDEDKVRNMNNIAKESIKYIILGFVILIIGLGISDCDKKKEEEVSESVVK